MRRTNSRIKWYDVTATSDFPIKPDEYSAESKFFLLIFHYLQV